MVERKSLPELNEKVMEEIRAELRDKIAIVESTALLTVIRDGLSNNQNNFTIEELMGGVFDLTEPILFEEEVYAPNKVSHGKVAVWDLLVMGYLILNPDRSIKVSDGFKNELLATLPKEEKVNS